MTTEIQLTKAQIALLKEIQANGYIWDTDKVKSRKALQALKLVQPWRSSCFKLSDLGKEWLQRSLAQNT